MRTVPVSVEDEARKILLDLGLRWPEADPGKPRSAAADTEHITEGEPRT
jgi:hypothetical protein